MTPSPPHDTHRSETQVLANCKTTLKLFPLKTLILIRSRPDGGRKFSAAAENFQPWQKKSVAVWPRTY